GALPRAPVRHVIFAAGFIRSEQGRDNLLTSFGPDFSEAESEDEFTMARGEVDFGGQCDVSVLRAVVHPQHLEMLRHVLPSVGNTDKSNGAFWHGRGASEGKGVGIALSEEHGPSLVFTHPPGIAVSHIGEV